MAEKPASPDLRRSLIVAAAVVFLLRSFVPFGRLILYPFTLLSTWVHEMGHGVAALVGGGRFSSLEIFANASGLAHVTYAPGWPDALTSLGGLVAPPLVGAAIILAARGPRRARVVLLGLGAAIAASTAIWVRSPAGWVALPLVAAAIVWAGLRFGPERRLVAAQFLGVVLALDTWTRLDYLFVKTAHVGGQERASDIARFAEVVGGPYLVWGLLVAALSLGAVALALWLTWRRAPAAASTRRR
jgi:hypothetical protein